MLGYNTFAYGSKRTTSIYQGLQNYFSLVKVVYFRKIYFNQNMQPFIFLFIANYGDATFVL